MNRCGRYRPTLVAPVCECPNRANKGLIFQQGQRLSCPCCHWFCCSNLMFQQPPGPDDVIIVQLLVCQPSKRTMAGPSKKSQSSFGPSPCFSSSSWKGIIIHSERRNSLFLEQKAPRVVGRLGRPPPGHLCYCCWRRQKKNDLSIPRLRRPRTSRRNIVSRLSYHLAGRLLLVGREVRRRLVTTTARSIATGRPAGPIIIVVSR
jgi:hypothetical protein